MNISRLGMGTLGDAAYDALYAKFVANSVPQSDFEGQFPNLTYPNPETCLKIQCGAMSQAEAGPDLLFACSNAGFVGVKTCANPLCAPYCGDTAAAVARASQPLPVAPRVEQMFRMGPQRGCDPVYWGPKFGGPYSDAPLCPGECAGDFVNQYPLLSVILLGAGAYGIYRWRAGR